MEKRSKASVKASHFEQPSHRFVKLFTSSSEERMRSGGLKEIIATRGSPATGAYPDLLFLSFLLVDDLATYATVLLWPAVFSLKA